MLNSNSTQQAQDGGRASIHRVHATLAQEQTASAKT